MEFLSERDRELVSLGAALGSNCVPCIEFHIPAARKAGLSDQEIGVAIRLADKVRQVPAAKVLEVALAMIGERGQSSRGACMDGASRSEAPPRHGCCA